MKYLPKVSIVIPAYNASNYLAEAIDSALSQTYPNIEVLVINDGSKDDGKTREVALRYGSRIRYFEKENGGSSSAINMGIRNMTGEWFAWLSHDDLYKPEKIYENIKALNELGLSEAELAGHIVVSASESIDHRGHLIRTPTKEQMTKMYRKVSEVRSNAEIIAEPKGFHFHGCTYFVHRIVLEAVGLFDEGLRLINDDDMWFRIFAGGYGLHYIPKVLVQGRIHSEQVSNTIGFSYHTAEQDMYWDRSYRWLTEHAPDAYELFCRFGKDAYSKTRNADGDRAFQHAMQICPQKKTQLRLKRAALLLRTGIWFCMKKVYLAIRVRKV